MLSLVAGPPHLLTLRFNQLWVQTQLPKGRGKTNVVCIVSYVIEKAQSFDVGRSMLIKQIQGHCGSQLTVFYAVAACRE